MKAVILAGGLGTRLSEETSVIPKPMVEIDGKPILWHLMKNLYSQGIKEFIICCGYKGIKIKEFFLNYGLHSSDIFYDGKTQKVEILKTDNEDWKVICADTGLNTMTGGRLKRIENYLSDDEPFLMTYGDGLANVDIKKLLKFHNKNSVMATLTSVIPPGRFGSIKIENDKVTRFIEKPQGDGSFVNGGFFILEKKVLSLIKGDESIWEGFPLENLSEQGQLSAFLHEGFWQPMDTLRDLNYLKSLVRDNKAPWINW